MEKQILQELIALFLQINPKPTDAQFHSFAQSINVDKEELESLSYEMLAEDIDDGEVGASSTHFENGEGVGDDNPELFSFDDPIEEAEGEVYADVDAPGDTEPSEAEDVMDGDYDPLTTSPDDLLLNDGAPAGTTNVQENQDAVYNDGVGGSDVGIDIHGDQPSTYNDGVSVVKLGAFARLQATAAESSSKWGLTFRAKTEMEKQLDRLQRMLDSFARDEKQGQLDYEGKMNYKATEREYADLARKIKKANG